MTDDPTMPLPKPPREDPGETLRPVKPAVPGGETESISPGTDAGAASDAAEHAALKVSSRRIKVCKLGPYAFVRLLGRGGMRGCGSRKRFHGSGADKDVLVW